MLPTQLRCGQGPSSKQPLDASHANVSQSIVPTQEFFLCLREVVVCAVQERPGWHSFDLVLLEGTHMDLGHGVSHGGLRKWEGSVRAVLDYDWRL